MKAYKVAKKKRPGVHSKIKHQGLRIQNFTRRKTEVKVNKIIP